MLTYVVDKKSRLETILAVLAALVVLPISFIAWLIVVVLALLYAMGVKLPPASTLSAAIISFAATIFLSLFIVSLMFLLWYLYRRSAWRRGHHKDRCRETYNHQSPPHANLKVRLTNFAADFDMLANLDSLMPQLCMRGLIHTHELEELLRCKLLYSRTYQMLHLLMLLEKRGRAGLVGVVQALKEDQEHIGHVDLANKLIKAHGAILNDSHPPVLKQNHGQFYV